MTRIFNRESEKGKRRDLRSALPPTEALLWKQLRNRQLLDCKFRRQVSVGPFVVDFYAPEIKLGIELDGDSHFEPGAAETDAKRQRFIESFGIQIIRFPNSEVFENMDGVLETLAQTIAARRSSLGDSSRDSGGPGRLMQSVE